MPGIVTTHDNGCYRAQSRSAPVQEFLTEWPDLFNDLQSLEPFSDNGISEDIG